MMYVATYSLNSEFHVTNIVEGVVLFISKVDTYHYERSWYCPPWTKSLPQLIC